MVVLICVSLVMMVGRRLRREGGDIGITMVKKIYKWKQKGHANTGLGRGWSGAVPVLGNTGHVTAGQGCPCGSTEAWVRASAPQPIPTEERKAPSPMSFLTGASFSSGFTSSLLSPSSTPPRALEQRNLGRWMICMWPQRSASVSSRVGLRGGARLGTHLWDPPSVAQSALDTEGGGAGGKRPSCRNVS